MASNNPYERLSNIEMTDYHSTRSSSQKITFIGDEHTGKTDLIRALVGKEAYPKDRESRDEHISIPSRLSNIEIECVDSTTKRSKRDTLNVHIKNSNQIILIFDMKNLASLDKLNHLITKIKSENPEATVTLVGTKDDTIGLEDAMTLEQAELEETTGHDNIIVEQPRIQEFAEKHHINKFVPVSASENKGIDELRHHIQHNAALLETIKQKTQIISSVRQKIKDFRFLDAAHDETTKNAINGIADILHDGLDAAEPQNYFEQNQSTIEKHLKTLQFTQASIFNSAVNVVALTFAACTIVGLPLLWIAGILKNNYEKTGHSFMFKATGEKQQAQELINDVLQNIKMRNQ